MKQHFSTIVEPHRIVYTVHGTFDPEGGVEIEHVYPGDAAVDMWPDLCETKLGDWIQRDCDEIAAREAALPVIEEET